MEAALAWSLATVGLAAAVVAALAWRAQVRRCVELEQRARALSDELEAERQGQQQRTRASEQRGHELTDLRRRLEKAKKRAFAAQEANASLEARLRELEGKAHTRDRRVHEAELEEERLRGKLERQSQELAGLRGKLARSSEARLDAEHAAALTRQVAAAEAQIRELTEKLQHAQREASRYRSRERTHRRLYTVIKGELDAAKERLRALEREAPGAPGEASIGVEAGSERGATEPPDSQQA